MRRETSIEVDFLSICRTNLELENQRHNRHNLMFTKSGLYSCQDTPDTRKAVAKLNAKQLSLLLKDGMDGMSVRIKNAGGGATHGCSAAWSTGCFTRQNRAMWPK